MVFFRGEKIKDSIKKIKKRGCSECNSMLKIMHKQTHIVEPNVKKTLILNCCPLCKNGEMINLYYDYDNYLLGVQVHETYYDGKSKTEPKKRLYYLRKPELTI